MTYFVEHLRYNLTRMNNRSNDEKNIFPKIRKLTILMPIIVFILGPIRSGFFLTV